MARMMFVSAALASMLTAWPGPAAAIDPDVAQIKSRLFALEAEVRQLQRQTPYGAPAAPAPRAGPDPALVQRLQTLELQVVGLERQVADLRKALAELEKRR